MHEISGWTATDMWLQALDNIIGCGQITYPRGFKCLEIMNAHLVTKMRKPIVTTPARELGYRFMFAEAYWILSGDNQVETITPYSKSIGKYSDDGITFFGAYGPKIINQIDYVVETLERDLWSRQAVINIWRENPPQTRDFPCTLSAQFLVRGDCLHCIDTMRSSDIWFGLPYDTFNFTMLSSVIILEIYKRTGLVLELGDLHFNLGSLHIYDKQVERAKICLLDPQGRKFRYPMLNPIEEFETTARLMDHLLAVAENRYGDLKSNWVHCVARGDHNKKGDSDGPQ